ncbi:glycosyltransferase family A protein [Pontibacter flavimaris]|nr:glycosyltransferase family A protein [Pontibacter flavimaris]
MHTTQPEVSIIMCMYNVEKYLREAINSVLHQTFPHWELLLIDDGSEDGSTLIARQYAAEYPARISYHDHGEHVNKGLSASRNLGLSLAKGELVAFLDADDVWLPNYLELQVNLLRQKNVPVICEATKYWYNWNAREKENQVVYIGAGQDQLYHPPQLMLELYPLGKGAAPCMCGIILEKELLQKLGGFENSFKGMYEDQVFLSKLYLNAPVYISSNHHNLYRQRADSLVGASQNTPAYHVVRKHYLDWLKKYLRQHPQKYKEIDRLLQQAWRQYSVSPLRLLVRFVPGRLKRFLRKHAPASLVRQVNLAGKVQINA